MTATPEYRSMLQGYTPRAGQILAARQSARLTQAAAARLIWVARRTWQDWEHGIARMHPAHWYAFNGRVSNMGRLTAAEFLERFRPGAAAVPICKCGKPLHHYGEVGGYSVACIECNAKNAARQRRNQMDCV